MTASPDDPDLVERAEEFADSLTTTVRKVFGPGTPRFAATYVPKKKEKRHLLVRTQTPKGEEAPPIPISIKGTRRLDLVVQLRCEWDGQRDYLAIEDSRIAVRMTGASEPLFRWEFLRQPKSDGVPSAHFHLHGHRDEIVFLLLTGGDGKRRTVERSSQLIEAQPTIPQVSALHIPLGGARFRPCLEDILQFLIEEFDVDSQPEAIEAICEGRRDWRRRQVATVVRDCPDEAVRLLKDLGYGITPPDEPPTERGDKLTMY